MIEYIGFAAGIIGTGCLIPQVIKTHKTGSADDFSLLYLIFLDIGFLLWFIYGISTKQTPLIMANSFAMIFISYILAVRLRLIK